MTYEYQGFEGDMILRDHLAYDRTKFALLRTFLSIGRTALGLLASGAGLIILQTSVALVSLGYALVTVAAAVMVAERRRIWAGIGLRRKQMMDAHCGHWLVSSSWSSTSRGGVPRPKSGTVRSSRARIPAAASGNAKASAIASRSHCICASNSPA